MSEEFKNYRHAITEEVKFHEVDMLGVCNNAVYLNYFEDARVRYVQELKKKYRLKELLEGDSFFIMARNEIDYHAPARFDDKLKVLTKIDFIKNTSFGFSHVIVRESDNRLIADGKGVVVHINFKTKQKQPLPQEFYDAVKDFEQDVLFKSN